MDFVLVENPATCGIFDSHAHYDDAKFDGVRDRILSSLGNMGVDGVINCGIDVDSSKAVIALAKKYPFLRSSVGFHPENLPSGEPDLSEIEALVSQDSVVAIGEIGLDYYWDKTNCELQKRWFSEQVMLANRLSLPVIVHDREAHADTLEILKETKPQGVVHCFSGSVQTAAEILKLGMYIGIGGVATFKNAKTSISVIEETPIERILLETDAPYLAPEPYRGKLCHSGMIIRVAEKIAKIKKIDTETVLKVTNKNARTLFNI